MNIIKMHGTGNTFYLVDERINGFISEDKKKSLVVSICNNDCEEQIDGVLFVEESLKCDVKMRIFNSDSSEPEMCGNGLRCFGRYVLEIENKEKITVETMCEIYEVENIENFYKGMNGIKINLKNVKHIVHNRIFEFEKKHIPYKFEYFTVSNPHIVSFTKNILSHDELKYIGFDANNSKNIFEDGINVNMITILSKEKIYVQTYERGVGITKSCGTGMTASSTYYSIINSEIGNEVKVYNDGGMILCTVTKENNGYSVNFIGNGTYIFTGKLDLDSYEISDIKYNKKEEELYDSFFKATRSEIDRY